jgi:hypothetical protein
MYPYIRQKTTVGFGLLLMASTTLSHLSEVEGVTQKANKCVNYFFDLKALIKQLH